MMHGGTDAAYCYCLRNICCDKCKFYKSRNEYELKRVVGLDYPVPVKLEENKNENNE